MLIKKPVHILIISQRMDYERLLKDNKCSQETSFLTTVSPTYEQLHDASIILYVDSTRKENANCHTLHIGIFDQSSSSMIQDYTMYDDVWFDSMNENLLKYRFQKVVERFIEKKQIEIYDIFLNTLMNSVPDLIWFKDLRGAHLKVNDAFGKVVGKSKEDCEGRGHYYIWDLEPDEYADGEYVCLETEEEVIKKGKTCLFDEKVKGKNGLRQFKTYKSPLYDYQGSMFGTVGIAKDVTDLHNISRELEVILSTVPFASLIVDEQDKLVYANQVFYDIFNLKTKDDNEFNYKVFCKEILHLDVLHLDKTKEEIVAVTNGNITQYLNVQQQIIKDIFGNHFGFFLICVDITKEKELQDRISHSANTDFLTGLFNRRFFYKEMHELNNRYKFAFVFFDLDCFKLINDTFGHQKGDEALKLMSTLLQKEFPNDLNVRLGGDEFLTAITQQTHVDEIILKVNRFVELAKYEFHSSKYFEQLSISAGISYGDIGFDTDQLLLEADNALYKAKTLGKGMVCVYSKDK